MRTLAMTSPEELRQADHKAVIAWERYIRAAFIATALENGAPLEDVQTAAGHRDPGTTKLYDRRGYNPEKAAAFFAIY
jgi:hypothetical protein